MLITCPSCASQYAIAPARIGSAGRDVRCATCRATWFVAPAAEESPTRLPVPTGRSGTPPMTIDGTARSRAAKRPAPSASRRASADRRLAPRLAIASLALVLAAGPAGIALRRPIVEAVPGSAGLFAALGLPVNVLGLRFEEVSSGTQEENGARVLFVEGAIRATERETNVPRIAYAIEADDGSILYHWSTNPPVERVGPAESVRFVARLAAPPPDGKRVLVTFEAGRAGKIVASH